VLGSQGTGCRGYRATGFRGCRGARAPRGRVPRFSGSGFRASDEVHRTSDIDHLGHWAPRCSATKAPGCQGARDIGTTDIGHRSPRPLGAEVLGHQGTGVPGCSGHWDNGHRTSDIDHLGHWAPRCSATKAPGCQGARDIGTTDIGQRAFSWGIEGGARAKSARGVSKDAPKASHRLPSSLQNFRFFRVPHPPYSALIAVLPPTPTDTGPLEAGYTKLKLLYLEF
jgi:hypothetical protein